MRLGREESQAHHRLFRYSSYFPGLCSRETILQGRGSFPGSSGTELLFVGRQDEDKLLDCRKQTQSFWLKQSQPTETKRYSDTLWDL